MVTPPGEDPAIFKFYGYRPYLLAWKDARDVRSYPWIATRLGCTQALVHGVMSGKKPITPKRVEDWIRVLKLPPGDEQEYFRLLVQAEHAPFARDREYAEVQLQRLRRKHGAERILPGDLWLFDEWYFLAIYELARCNGFRAEAAWVARTLSPPIAIKAAADALDLLFERGLLVRSPSGEVTPRSVDLILEPGADPELYRTCMAAYHRWWVERAPAAIAEFPSSLRDYRALTLSVPAARYPEVVAMLRACQADILALCENEGERGDRVYIANLQLFPLSEDTRGG